VSNRHANVWKWHACCRFLNIFLLRHAYFFKTHARVWFQHARVWYQHAECDFHTLGCDFHTHGCDFVPLECDFYTQSMIFIRKVSYPVITKDFARWLLNSTKSWWTLAWIGSYLTGHEQLVKASGSQSRRFSVRSGIPQGTQLKTIFMCNHCFHSWQLCALLFKQWIHKQNQ
jgi:hypothetical protein